MTRQDLLIQPPPRASLTGTIIVVLVVLLLSVASFVPSLRACAVPVSLVFFAAALLLRQYSVLFITLLALLIIAVPFLHPLVRNWPWRLLGPVALFLAATLPFRRLRLEYGWFRRGRTDRETALATAGIIVVSAVALVLWVWTLKPDLSRHLANIPAMSVWLLPIAGSAFAFGNAAVEEFVFRGVYMHSLDSALGQGYASVLLQGWLFGAFHYLAGFPNGPAGLVLASVYGVMLGLLRRRSRGMLAPWLAHAGADMAIFLILIQKVP